MSFLAFIHGMTNRMNMTERAFIIDQQLHGLLQQWDKPSYSSNDESNTNTQLTNNIGMQAIVNAVQQPHLAISKQTLACVNTSLRYFTWYKQVLSVVTMMQSKTQAAASGSAQKDDANIQDFTRKGGGFSLKVIQDSNHEDAYIVLKLDAIRQNKGVNQESSDVFLHCLHEQRIDLVQFTYVNDSKYQAIVNRGDKALETIMDNESHLYLT
jgi:hypothetical protein